MEASLIIRLIAEVGLPLAEKLIAAHHAREEITPAKWEELRQLARYTSAEALAKAQGKCQLPASAS